jgi:TRAP-type C4-dicarboxylate transport system permease small subunit
VRKAADAVAALLVAGVFVAILIGVARRYVLGAPLVWIDELASVLFVWTIFWSGAFVVRLHEHVAFDLLVQALPPSGRRWVAFAAATIVGAALLAALPKLGGYIAFLWRERTPALQWRLDYVYACFTLFVAASGVFFLGRALNLLRRRWRELV